MTNSKSTGNLICLVAALVVAVLACAGTSAGAGAEWDVYPGESIQATIDGASEGDTIYVHAGVYVENVDVGKRLTLAGEDADVVTVTAASSSDHVFEVTADYVNISGFTATGATSHAYAGIYLSSADHCNISENDCSNNDDGIRLYSSSDNTLANNTANSNNDGGIWLDSSSDDNMLTSNTASDNYYGISLSYSSNNTLASNTMSGNTYNFYVYGSSLSGYTQNIDTSNTVDEKPIYYWVDQKDRQIPSDAGFVGVVNGTNITVRDLTLTNNGKGVLFTYTENSRIENVTASNNDDGICLYSSSNNTLASNNADSNNDCGIHMYSSSNNTLASNTANSNNDCGIRLDSSINNIVYNNCFNNTANAYDTGNNQWDSGIVGNYWSDYREKYPDAEELYESEIWDTPYVVRLITSLTSKSSTHRLPPKWILGP